MYHPEKKWKKSITEKWEENGLPGMKTADKISTAATAGVKCVPRFDVVCKTGQNDLLLGSCKWSCDVLKTGNQLIIYMTTTV